MAAGVRLRWARHGGGRDNSSTLLVHGYIGSPAFKILLLLSGSNLVELLLSHLSVSQLSDALAAQPFVDDPSVDYPIVVYDMAAPVNYQHTLVGHDPAAVIMLPEMIVADEREQAHGQAKVETDPNPHPVVVPDPSHEERARRQRRPT